MYFATNGTRASWCQEMCDPVEQIGYGVMVNGVNVSVSDFVFPTFLIRMLRCHKILL